MKIEGRRAIQHTFSYRSLQSILNEQQTSAYFCTIIVCIFSGCIRILYTYSLSRVLALPINLYIITSQARRALFNFAIMQDHHDHASADRGRMARRSHILFNKLKHNVQNKNNNNYSLIKMRDTTQRWIVIVLCIDEVWQYTIALIIQNSS